MKRIFVGQDQSDAIHEIQKYYPNEWKTEPSGDILISPINEIIKQKPLFCSYLKK